MGSLNLPGRRKPEPLAENGRPLRGGIAEKVFADINGVRQGMFIEGKDAAHPVLLWLHGGLPEYFLTERYPPALRMTSRWSGGNSAAPACLTAGVSRRKR
jgi:hypothetical protein